MASAPDTTDSPVVRPLTVVYRPIGCLVPDPEKFPEPERTAILVDTNLVSPPISQILRVNPPEVREFQIPFRSVDLGDPPAAYLYLDYDTPQEVPGVTFGVFADPLGHKVGVAAS